MIKLLILSALLLATSAAAQTTPPTTSFSPTTATSLTDASLLALRRERDTLGITLFWENDGGYSNIIPSGDRWYTAGAGFAVQWQTEETSELISELPSIGGEFGPDRPDTSSAAGVSGILNIFTPDDLADPNPIFDDRPYSGWMYAGLIVQRAQRGTGTPTFEHIELDLGGLAAASPAANIQEWMHSTFGATYPEGWNNQGVGEFGADFKYQRRWRIGLSEPDPAHSFGADLIPDASFTVGTVNINATGGATVRAGWNLPDDFGPATLKYAGDFTRPFDAGHSVHGISGYFFARAGGELVAHNATLGDSYFHDNLVEVDAEPFGLQGSVGVCVLFLEHCQFMYAESILSPEFTEQGQWQSFASISLSLVYTW